MQEGGERPAAKGDLGPRAEAATPRATLLGAHSARTLGGTVPTLMATPFSVGHCLFVKEKNPCVRREARQMPCLTERSPERGSGLPQSMYGGHGRGRPTSSPPGSVSGPLSCHPPETNPEKCWQNPEGRKPGGPEPQQAEPPAPPTLRSCAWESPSLFYPTHRTPHSLPVQSPIHTPVAPKWSLPWHFPEPGLGAVPLEASPKPSCPLGSA